MAQSFNIIFLLYSLTTLIFNQRRDVNELVLVGKYATTMKTSQTVVTLVFCFAFGVA